MFIDSHCHLTFPGLRERLADVRARMREAGVVRALAVCTHLGEADDVRRLAESHDDIDASAGVHPDQAEGPEATEDELVALGRHARVVAIGETGLDYLHAAADDQAPAPGDGQARSSPSRAVQRERFRRHVRAARVLGKPLIVHTRAASDDTLAVMRDERATDAGGVFHCFTETEAVARAALDLGFAISFSGILTFRNAEELRRVAAFVPLERCLVETDSPYLAPVPHRGKPNEPSLVPFVARELARVKGVDVEAVAAATSENYRRLFLRSAAVVPG